MKLRTYTGEELKAHRSNLGLNQVEFWGKLGITQSGGSRYESGRAVPEPVQILLNLALGSETKSTTLLVGLRALAKRKRNTRPAPRCRPGPSDAESA